jgi:hypothetical protein
LQQYRHNCGLFSRSTQAASPVAFPSFFFSSDTVLAVKNSNFVGPENGDPPVSGDKDIVSMAISGEPPAAAIKASPP